MQDLICHRATSFEKMLKRRWNSWHCGCMLEISTWLRTSKNFIALSIKVKCRFLPNYNIWHSKSSMEILQIFSYIWSTLYTLCYIWSRLFSIHILVKYIFQENLYMKLHKRSGSHRKVYATIISIQYQKSLLLHIT